MSRAYACAALSDFDLSSEDSSSSEEDENVNYKKRKDDFIGLCLMVKERSSRNNFDPDSDSDVSDNLTCFTNCCVNILITCFATNMFFSVLIGSDDAIRV
jgi:hypothetical protein